MTQSRDQRLGTLEPITRPSNEYSSRSKPGPFQSGPIQSGPIQLGPMQKKQSFNETNDELRKAAILIDSLDDDSARLFLRKLNMNTAREIHQLAKDLGRVTKEEKENVLAEFLKRIQQISSSEKA